MLIILYYLFVFAFGITLVWKKVNLGFTMNQFDKNNEKIYFMQTLSLVFRSKLGKLYFSSKLISFLKMMSRINDMEVSLIYFSFILFPNLFFLPWMKRGIQNSDEEFSKLKNQQGSVFIMPPFSGGRMAMFVVAHFLMMQGQDVLIFLPGRFFDQMKNKIQCESNNILELDRADMPYKCLKNKKSGKIILLDAENEKSMLYCLRSLKKNNALNIIISPFVINNKTEMKGEKKLYYKSFLGGRFVVKNYLQKFMEITQVQVIPVHFLWKRSFLDLKINFGQPVKEDFKNFDIIDYCLSEIEPDVLDHPMRFLPLRINYMWKDFSPRKVQDEKEIFRAVFKKRHEILAVTNAGRIIRKELK